MTILRKTDAEFPGPWLLEKDALIELDKIIDEASQIFERAQKKEIKRLIRKESDEAKNSQHYGLLSPERQKIELKRIRHRIRSSTQFSMRRREIQISVKSRKKMPLVAKFSEAIAHPDMTKEVATLFHLVIDYGSIKAEVRTSSLWSDKLQINVSPPDGEGCYDLYVTLHQWAERNQPNRATILWHAYSGIHWLAILLMQLFIFFIFAASKTSTSDHFKLEARNMLTDGFTSDQDHKALELLLAINSGFSPKTTASQLESIALYAIYGLLIFGILFSYSPKSRLAIGKGEQAIKWQRIWSNFLLKGLIGALALGIITDIFRTWVIKLIGF